MVVCIFCICCGGCGGVPNTCWDTGAIRGSLRPCHTSRPRHTSPSPSRGPKKCAPEALAPLSTKAVQFNVLKPKPLGTDFLARRVRVRSRSGGGGAGILYRSVCARVCVCVSTPGQRVSFDQLQSGRGTAGGSRVCSWREPTKLQVQTRISKEDALSTYLQPELLTTLSNLLCLIPWFFMLPTPKPGFLPLPSAAEIQPRGVSADAKHC